MMRSGNLIVLICFFIIYENTRAQIGESTSAHSISLSGADIATCYHGSGNTNPAALARYNYNIVQIDFSNRYRLPEMGHSLLTGTIDTEHGTFAPAISYFGQKSFNQSSASLSYGLELTPSVGVGIRMEYHHIAIEVLDHTASAITGDLGVILNPTDRIYLGVLINNPAGSVYNDIQGIRLPGGLKIGISYLEKHNFCLSALLSWNNFRSLSYSFGSEYQLYDFLTISAGIKFPEILSYSFGIDLNLDRVSVGLGFEQHSILGLSSAISLTYKIR